MARLFALAAALLLVGNLVTADVYMHNPRGSNDRNCERNVNRRNGNRLFDSQNNNKGGYACGRAVGGPDVVRKDMYFYAGSMLPVEWTNQHGCGANGKLHCEIVLQYACEDTLDPTGKFRGAGATDIGTPRDGIPRDAQDSATDRIPDNEASAKADTTETRRFGMHESYDYYQKCKQRERNKGLFTADQNLKRRDARATRQNPNGNRNGLECPEERDYYPYWAPTPWRDIALITSNLSPNKETYYKANSQNRNGNFGECAVPDGNRLKQRGEVPNSQSACEAAGFTWNKVAAKGGDVMEVIQGQFSRVNQLGNSAGAVATGSASDQAPQGLNANRYMWKIPNTPNKNCVLRMRYNISTYDYDAWQGGNLNLASSFTATGTPGINATSNDRKKVQDKVQLPGVPLTKSPITQDPYVSIGQGEREFVSLALNTNQYGRTFQDRSYVFEIRARPAGVPACPGVGCIMNLNVRGKRGNIVQTYPAVEYDFVPNDLALRRDDRIHFQWTGSDYNPRRGCNNGEGGPPDPPGNEEAGRKNSRADRSNIIETMDKMSGANYPADVRTVAAAQDIGLVNGRKGSMFTTVDRNTPDRSTLMKMAFLNQDQTLSAQGKQCLSVTELAAIKNKNQRENHPRNCAKLNAQATPYFDGGVVQMKKAGKFSYFSSRNNNFSNRDQTGQICVAAGGITCDVDANTGAVKSNEDDDVFLAEVQKRQFAAGLIADEPEPEPVLIAQDTETSGPQEKDNEAEGDGNAEACEEILWEFFKGLGIGGVIGLGFGCVALGAMSAILGMALYNRHQRRKGSGAAKNLGMSSRDPVKGTSAKSPAGEVVTTGRFNAGPSDRL